MAKTMARLISIEDPLIGPPRLLLAVGDLLVCWASGGRVHPGGAERLELLGFFQSGDVVGELATDEALPVPAGPPDRVVFLARLPGHATIDLLTGSPWYGSHTTSLELEIKEI
jgi:hypothetical protein